MRQESTIMNTEIRTIGAAVLIQNAIRMAACVAIVWLVLSFADRWIMAWIAA
ncbi:MAG: hypothetical protein R3197_00265 [Paracoccaceae bacterium]|nr:hypothetical protein [Paracoccaceae bacterium]